MTPLTVAELALLWQIQDSARRNREALIDAQVAERFALLDGLMVGDYFLKTGQVLEDIVSILRDQERRLARLEG